MNEWYIAIAVVVVFYAVWAIVEGLRTRLVIQEYEKALRFRKGRLVAPLEPGEVILWGRGHEVKRVDGRWQEFVVMGQEFLTADRAAVKVSGVVRYRVADAVKFFTESMEPLATVHTATQIALRDVIGLLGVEAILERQDDLGEKLKSLVAPVAEALGIEIDAVIARDLMLGGDLKRAYQASLTAKQEALAGLEKARGEAAAMRVMANATRVFEKNPALLQLRTLEAIAKLGEGYNNHFVLGSIDSLLKGVTGENE